MLFRLKRLAWMRPSARELLFAIVFDVCAIVATGLVGVAVVMVWPSLLGWMLVAVGVLGIPIAVTGQLLSYRFEDRYRAYRNRLCR